MSERTETTRPPLAEEVRKVADLARALVTSHEARNPTSTHATLGEEHAIFELRWQLNELAKRCSGGN